MSKKAFLAVARKPAETAILSNDQQIDIRKFTQGEFESVIRATAKIDEKTRAVALQLKLIALTVSISGEAFTEDELRMGLDADLLREIGEHVSRVNGLNKTSENVEGN
jgi:hypothetical protein